MYIQHLKSWKRSYDLKARHCGKERAYYYGVAAKYLPSDEDAVIVDIGCGEGQFADSLELDRRHKNLYLLDASVETIDRLKTRFKNVILYKVPDRLPFGDRSVRFVHCSHIIEHLYHHQFYQFLKEVDRVLVSEGIFIVSAPLLHSAFYDDLTHVKPYNPTVLIKYLSSPLGSPSKPIISQRYSLVELVYRYGTADLDEGLGSNIMLVDFIVRLLKRFLSKIGLKNYMKNGYTLVLLKKD